MPDHKRMSEVPENADPNRAFFEKATAALRDLFARAQAAHELHFVMGLMPEFRGMQDAGWNTAQEAVRAYDEFFDLIQSLDRENFVRARVILSLYLQISEGSGFWEVPKKMLLTIEGKGNNMWPFQDLVERHRVTGEVMAPNANRIMKDMIGHAADLGLKELAEVLRDAFDPGIRNAVAHADYILWRDGMRLPHRNGGPSRIIPWNEFDTIVTRGLNIFSLVRGIASEFVQGYHPPKVIRARLNEHEPESEYTLFFDPEKGTFGMTTGGKPGEIPKG
jgi:hypothetical protein